MDVSNAVRELASFLSFHAHKREFALDDRRRQRLAVIHALLRQGIDAALDIDAQLGKKLWPFLTGTAVQKHDVQRLFRNAPPKRVQLVLEKACLATVERKMGLSCDLK